MAETVLTPITQGIFEKLSSEALRQLGLFFGLRKELESLQETVSTIKDTLLVAERQPNERADVQALLKRLVDAVYDADDTVDDFHTEALRQQVMRENSKWNKKVPIFFSRSNQLVYAYKMNCKLKVIRERLDKIASDWDKFGFCKIVGNVPSSSSSLMFDREDAVSTEPEVVIGREEDTKLILDLLLKSGSNCEKTAKVEVVSVVGIGGMGKTTIAQSVFNHKEIEMCFKLKMWVCVSNNFKVDLLAAKILERATNQKSDQFLSLETLRDHLHRVLAGKVYFLVLDDVWNEDFEQWNRLMRLLKVGETGSKILLTTRSDQVATITHSVKHKLKGLPKEQSLSLFQQMVFMQGTTNQVSPYLITIEEKIVERCGGNPLAIKTIARLLGSKNPTEWHNFMDLELSEMVEGEEDILPMLKVSYDHLTPHLKHCFSYCALFPEDYVIEKQTLIQLWMAHGFIQDEDEGDRYFQFLLWRSLFEEVERLLW